MRNLLYTLCVIAIVMACDGNGSETRRSDELTARLNVVDDSIMAHSSRVPDMAAKGMAEAEDSLEWYDYSLRLGKYYMIAQKYDSLQHYADRAIDFADRHEPTARLNGLKAMAYECKAVYWQRQRMNTDMVIALRTKAYEAMMSSDNTDFLPEVCANMADTYILNNDMAQAAYWYRRALFLVDSLALPEIKNVTLYLGLAQVYMNLEDYETSLHYYRETEKFYDRIPVNMQVYFLNNFGNYYYYREDYENALSQFLRLRELLAKYDYSGIDLAICKVNLADVYLNLDSLRKAACFVDKAEQYFADKGIVSGLYYANSIRIGMAVRLGRMSDVQRILRGEDFAPPQEYGLVSIRNRYLREYYTATGNWQAAYENLQGSNRMRDSIRMEHEYMRADEIVQRLREDTLLLHHKMEMQRKDAALRATHTLAGTVVVVFILIMFWWVAYSRKRKLQIEMDMMQLRLDNARNRISPHFIFNVLNNHISSAGAKEGNELMMLVKLIRANLDISRNSFVSLAEEMAFVNYYIDIERTILGDDFTVEINAPDDAVLSGISIPTMFVQILVENAIKHGLKGKDGPKRLAIDIVVGQEGVDIVVADNGRGFDIRAVRRGGTRTGLDIIRHTMRIVNERRKRDDMTMDISNRKDADGAVTGCEVRLHLPVISGGL